MIYRTWICLNRHCLHENTVADVEYPPCPRCGGAKVKWVPRTVGVLSSRTRNIDQTVRELARETYTDQGDKNWNSPRRGERAAPRVNPSLGSNVMPYTPAGAPAWGANLPVDPKTGAPLAYCGNTNVTAPLRAEVGRAYGGQQRLKPVPKIEGSWGSPADIQR